MEECAWPKDLSTEYSTAAIRLATTTTGGVQQQVFAWVELYPHEVPPPATMAEKKNLGPHTIRYTLQVVDVPAALAWYDAVASGTPSIPGAPSALLAPVELAPEPAPGRLAVGTDIPFEPRWHAGARLHRLVNMRDPEASVGWLASPGENPDQWEKARTWLADQLNFDVLASDDWIGGCALLAPNPTVRRLKLARIAATATGGETSRIEADLRTGTDHLDLSVRMVERRFGGTVHVSDHLLDAFGSAEVDLPQPAEHIGYELRSRRCGLLACQPPLRRLSTINLNIAIKAGRVKVEVPSPKTSGTPTEYERDIVHAAGTTTLQVPVSDEGPVRLRELMRRRNRRTGSARPDGQEGANDTFIFDNDRDAAVRIIRGLLSNARDRVIFVDPFFDELSLRDFALAVPSREVEIQILTNYRAEGRDADGEPVPMERLEQDLRRSTELREAGALGIVDVRVAGGALRRYHDRFLVIDADAWHCGHSFAQVGRLELSAMTRLRRPEQVIGLIERDFALAEPFADEHRRWLDRQPPPPPAWRLDALRLARQVAKLLETGS